MAGRPPTSSGRPYTADRPMTARPQSSRAAYFDRDPQYTFSQEYTIDEDEDDESDAEGVFAFEPPSTAQAIDEAPEQHAYFHDPPPVTPTFAHVHPPIATVPVSIPPPTFDMYGRMTPGPIPGPSTLHSRHPYPMSPVETPPSSDSQDHDGNPYRMRPLSQVPTSAVTSTPGSGTGKFSAISSAYSARGAPITFTEAKEKFREFASLEEIKGIPTTPGSASFSLEMDSQEGSVKMGYEFDDLTEEEDSPYPEVRASVSNIDDPEMPTLTFRMWLIGFSTTFISAAANTFFFLRQPAPSISTTILILVSHPLGKFLAYCLPITTYRLPQWLGGYEFSFNPGPWNIKEHALVYMMANVATTAPYALQATISIEINYGENLGYWFNVLIVLATQLTGFGLAGFCKRFLVWPASVVWPQNLVTCTLLNTLHAEEDVGSGGLSRFKYLVYVGSAAFVWYWLPGYLFTALSVFSWVCWIAPDNVPINQLFGVESGLGMGIITFDWTEISWINSPLMVPWWAQVQVMVGFVLVYWFLTPALYYSNVWNLAYFPMISDDLYDKYGDVYNVTNVLDTSGRFNATAYSDYSNLYLPAAWVMAYLTAFAVASCAIVHTILFHGRTILNVFKRREEEKDDIHAKLMRAYPEVPAWWYICIFVVFLAVAIVAVEVWHTGTPVWFLFLALLIPIVYIIPSGYVYSLTGSILSLNIIAQVIPGTALSGEPIPNMIFKSYALQSLSEGSRFVQDLKLGHYIKVPPRATFLVQLTSTLLVAFLQVGMQQWLFNAVPDICATHQKYDLTCPHNEVFYEASVLWGVIGPSRQFGVRSVYHPLVYALIVGAVLPIPFWLWQRRHPDSWTRLVNMPLILNSVGQIPPATGINYSAWFLMGFIFQYLIRKRNFAWWSRFNYLTSAALDSGTVIALLLIFFTLEFPKGGIDIPWWGNDIYKRTADYEAASLYTIPATGIPL